MRTFLLLSLAIISGCAVINPGGVTGVWRFDTEDGSWVRMALFEDGTGQKTTWHAENKGGMNNHFYWEIRGAKISIREISFLDDLGAAEVLDEARLSKERDEEIQLILKNYHRPFVREQ